jgi:EmrB/QacA subfamily drug resistance transporter
VAQLMVVLDATIVTVALPRIQSGLHFRSQLSLQWVINAYLLLFGGFLLLGGRAGDLYGRRKLFIIGLAVFTAASFANGLAQSTGVLIAGRAAQGLGGALVAPAVLSIIVATFPETGERTRALAAFSAVSAGGGAIGLLLGGVLTELVSWRWIFLVNVPIGIAAVLLAMRFVPESRAEDGGTRAIDIPGAITVTGGVSLLVFAVVNGQHWGWSSPRIIGLLAAATALVLAFVVIELRSRAPLIRLAIFKSRALSAANLTMFLFVAGQYSTLFFPTLYMQVVLGYSPLKTGLAYLPSAVGFVAGAVAGQRLIPRIGARATIVLGALLGAGGLILLSRLPDNASWAAYILPGFLVGSAGIGLAFETILLVATAGVSSDEAGLASGIVNTSQQLGAAIGLATLTAIAASRTAHLLRSVGSPVRYSHALVSGFDRGLLIAALLMLAAGLVAIVAMRRTDLAQGSAAEPQPAAPPAVVTGRSPISRGGSTALNARSGYGDNARSIWVRELISSLMNTLLRWYLTVRGLMNNRVPISGLESPSRASSAICRSCAVSSSRVSTVRFRTVSPVAISSRLARWANASIPIVVSISWAVRSCSRASTRRRSRRSHSP